jgi:hypothetical protein
MYGRFSLISRLISPAFYCSHPGANERSRTGKGTWGVRVHQDLNSLPSLSMLSDDILVDHIFSYLMVEDILCLRMVLSTFHLPAVTKLLALGQQTVLQPYAPWYNMEAVFAEDRTQCACITPLSTLFSSFLDFL